MHQTSIFDFLKSHTRGGQRIDLKLGTELCPTHSWRVKSKKESAGTQSEHLARVSLGMSQRCPPVVSQKTLMPAAVFRVGRSGSDIQEMLSVSFLGCTAATDSASALWELRSDWRAPGQTRGFEQALMLWSAQAKGSFLRFLRAVLRSRNWVVFK